MATLPRSCGNCEYSAASIRSAKAVLPATALPRFEPLVGSSRITKIGPVLTGRVDLSFTATTATTSRLEQVEDLRVPAVPQFLAKPFAAAARKGFQTSITRMATLLSTR